MTDHLPGPRRLVVFTDLDGTLLDHDDYSWAAAAPALAALAGAGVPLVLASSKTAAEISALHEELRLGTAPAIVENGAAVFRPGADTRDASAYARLRAALDRLPADQRRCFRGFGDMDAGEVAEATGLSPNAAVLAKRRAHSEPGLWLCDSAATDGFVTALAQRGISARRGGRFLTLSFGGTKAGQMRDIAAGLGAEVTLALGDAPNDIEMLEAADHGVIVRNDAGPGLPPLAGESTGRITRTELAGPAGWNIAVLEFLNQLGAGEAQATNG